MRTRVGYTGGTRDAPTYDALGDHAEALQVDFDPSRTSFAELLAFFWESHRPQRPSYSRQYRAALFYADAHQRALAEQSGERVAAQLGKPVLTAIEPLGRFWRAEDYHQKYALRRHAELMRAFTAYTPRTFTDSTVAARLNAFVSGHGSLELLEAAAEAYGLPESSLLRIRALLRREGRPEAGVH